MRNLDKDNSVEKRTIYLFTMLMNRGIVPLNQTKDIKMLIRKTVDAAYQDGYIDGYVPENKNVKS